MRYCRRRQYRSGWRTRSWSGLHDYRKLSRITRVEHGRGCQGLINHLGDKKKAQGVMIWGLFLLFNRVLLSLSHILIVWIKRVNLSVWKSWPSHLKGIRSKAGGQGKVKVTKLRQTQRWQRFHAVCGTWCRWQPRLDGQLSYCWVENWSP